ncbi:hypothetical protein M513_04566 [Trichuris suis]|uniref:Uncharacterized protein n=1 Tax=Trichuris suis TaxID=68888 RepID=A0A085MBM5_9BILA|nr:hypothetical protein M513_04566 [Trichuris suis]
MDHRMATLCFEILLLFITLHTAHTGMKMQVPKRLQSWNVDYPKYQPINYSWPCETLTNCDSENRFSLKFNVMDGPIDRRRAKGRCGRKKIELKNGYPLNPEGRTGVRGRGAEKDKHVECLTRKNDGSGSAHIFSVWFDNFTEGFRKIEVLEDGKNLLLRRNVSSKKVEKVLNRLQKYSFQLFSGNAPFHGNTDNAWLETHAYAVFCTKSSIFCEQGINYDKYGWKMVRQNETTVIGRSLLVSLNASTEGRNESNYEVFSCKPKGTKGIIQTAIGAFLLPPSLLATGFTSYLLAGLGVIPSVLPFLGLGLATAVVFLVTACVLLGVGLTKVRDNNKLSKYI